MCSLSVPLCSIFLSVCLIRLEHPFAQDLPSRAARVLCQKAMCLLGNRVEGEFTLQCQERYLSASCEDLARKFSRDSCRHLDTSYGVSSATVNRLPIIVPCPSPRNQHHSCLRHQPPGFAGDRLGPLLLIRIGPWLAYQALSSAQFLHA